MSGHDREWLAACRGEGRTFSDFDTGGKLTEIGLAGVVAIPHGWGHKGTGGWQLANRAGGANVNRLTSSEPGDVEAMSGMAWLTGVPVRVERIDSASTPSNVE